MDGHARSATLVAIYGLTQPAQLARSITSILRCLTFTLGRGVIISRPAGVAETPRCSPDCHPSPKSFLTSVPTGVNRYTYEVVRHAGPLEVGRVSIGMA